MARLKQVPVRVGDSLQGIAQRELGNGLLWRELVTLNRLTPPYLVASVNPDDRIDGALLWGDMISVPLKSTNKSAVVGEDALGCDVRVTRGQLTSENGDLSVVSGVSNYGQALRHRIGVPLKTFIPHPSYGCEVHTVLGLGNNQTVALLAAGFVNRAIARDPRTVKGSAAGTVNGDRLKIAAQVLPVNQDTIIDANATFQLPKM